MIQDLITVEKDDFHNAVVTSHNDKIRPNYYKYAVQIWFQLRHVKTDDNKTNSIALDLSYTGDDWLFLRDGELIINCDGENLTFAPSEIDSNTAVDDIKDDVNCLEEVFYTFTEEGLEVMG